MVGDGASVERMPVPGGWLYKTEVWETVYPVDGGREHLRLVAMSTAFVPHLPSPFGAFGGGR